MITFTIPDFTLATMDPFQDDLTHDERNLIMSNSVEAPNCGSRMPLSRVKARIDEYLDC